MRMFDLRSPHCDKARMYWEPVLRDKRGKLVKPRLKRYRCKHDD